MVERAVFALADERGAGQDDRQHRDIVDDAHDAGEPRRLDIRVEGDAHDEVDRRCGRALGARQKIGDLGGDNLLCVIGPETGLDHRGRIDIELDRRFAAAKT